jgi:hypothetical protein
MKRGDKRAQEMTLGTVILIVLGIAVLVFLVFGFSTGWSNLWDRVTNFSGGSSNLDTIKQSCALACTGQSTDAFCNEVRTVKFGGEKQAWDGTAIVNSKTATGTCSDFAKNEKAENSTGVEVPKYPGLSVASCPSISCD